ncbi:DNA polymerase III [Candidatus Regiella insecticola 5.15]|uniref:DNA polymerase III subunit delta' n=2 Tax=Candidatus Regiella insecticola TaxID=138073 RepID=G2H0K8_9ENTR|nr:DNA polymerase III [Candidatus Regiella insecticola 5.15]
MMTWYPWLTAPYHQLLNQHIIGRGHHALLLHALPGNGAESLFYGLSRWLMCQQKQNDKSCGRCHSCCLMLAGNHPDYYHLMPEKGKTRLGIESIRQITEKLSSHAQQGGAKVILLPQVEQFTDIAVNALLKTLEDPPEETYFVLGCYQPSRVLATLRSRCFYWHLASQDPDLSVRWLSDQVMAESTVILTALRLTNGAPLAAKQLLEPAHWQQRTVCCTALSRALLSGDMLSLLPQLHHDEVNERLHWLISLLLDALKWQHRSGDFIVNQDQLPLVQQLMQKLSIEALLKSANQWMYCRHQLLSIVGLNRELVITEQLLNWESMLS